MMHKYLIIGSFFGGIFALAMIFIIKVDGSYIVKAKQRFGKNIAFVFTAAVAINVIFWPIVAAFLLNRILKRIFG